MDGKSLAPGYVNVWNGRCVDRPWLRWVQTFPIRNGFKWLERSLTGLGCLPNPDVLDKLDSRRSSTKKQQRHRTDGDCAPVCSIILPDDYTTLATDWGFVSQLSFVFFFIQQFYSVFPPQNNFISNITNVLCTCAAGNFNKFFPK